MRSRLASSLAFALSPSRVAVVQRHDGRRAHHLLRVRGRGAAARRSRSRRRRAATGIQRAAQRAKMYIGALYFDESPPRPASTRPSASRPDIYAAQVPGGRRGRPPLDRRRRSSRSTATARPTPRSAGTSGSPTATSTRPSTSAPHRRPARASPRGSRTTSPSRSARSSRSTATAAARARGSESSTPGSRGSTRSASSASSRSAAVDLAVLPGRDALTSPSTRGSWFLDTQHRLRERARDAGTATRLPGATTNAERRRYENGASRARDDGDVRRRLRVQLGRQQLHRRVLHPRHELPGAAPTRLCSGRLLRGASRADGLRGVRSHVHTSK